MGRGLTYRLAMMRGVKTSMPSSRSSKEVRPFATASRRKTTSHRPLSTRHPDHSGAMSAITGTVMTVYQMKVVTTHLRRDACMLRRAAGLHRGCKGPAGGLQGACIGAARGLQRGLHRGCRGLHEGTSSM